MAIAAHDARIWNLVRGGGACPSNLHTTSPFWPHLSVALEDLRRATGGLPERLADSMVDAFLSALDTRMDLLARQAVIMECALYRATSSDIHPLTVLDFGRACQAEPAYLEPLLTAYPELADLLAVCVANSAAYAEEVRRALLADWDAVARELAGPGAPGLSELASLQVASSASDNHAGGRTVVAVAAGDGRPIAGFKPRTMGLEAGVLDVLRALAGGHPRLAGWTFPRCVLREGHGWVEWIEQRPCASEADVDRYYLRAGALTAMSTALGVTDLMCENLVAHGDSPVPIDLEATLHHRKNPQAPSRSGWRLPRLMEWNSISTGLLPSWIWKGEDLRGIDVSGLGALGEQYCSLPLYHIIERDSAGERLVQGGVYLYPTHNVVVHDGREQKPWDHLAAIQEGFEIGCALVSERRAWLGERLAALDRLPARFLARPTTGYYYAIQASVHPAYLRRPGERRAFLESAMRDTGQVDEKLVDAEVRACMMADIPRFETTAAALVITEPTYGHPIDLDPEEYLTGASTVLRDLGDFANPSRVVFEKRLIFGSLTALQMAHEAPDRPPVELDQPGPLSAPLPELEEGACRAAAGVLTGYLTQDMPPEYWYGFRETPDAGYEFGLLGSDLYAGVPGVLYALDRTRQRLPAEAGPALAEATRAMAGTIAERLDNAIERLGGAYFGLLSAILPLLSALDAGAPERALLVDAAHRALDATLSERRTTQQFWGFDLTTGVAGALAVAVSVTRVTGQDRWHGVVDRLVARLRGAAELRDGRATWAQPAIATGPAAALTGLSHGQIGCAVALAEAATLPGLPDATRQVAADLARGAGRWELDQFSDRHGNFPDYRHDAPRAERGELAWSHGAPGSTFAIQRVCGLVDWPDGAGFLAGHPIAALVDRWTSREPELRPLNASLSHGALGLYVMTWLLVGGRPSDLAGDVVRRVEEWTGLGRFAQFETRPFRQGTLDAPGLFIGRAGSLLGFAAVLDGDPGSIPFLPHVLERR